MVLHTPLPSIDHSVSGICSYYHYLEVPCLKKLTVNEAYDKALVVGETLLHYFLPLRSLVRDPLPRYIL
jgi:hypothetical protein